MLEIGRLLVFIRKHTNHGPEGPILYAEPPLAAAIEEWNGAMDAGDLDFTETNVTALEGLVVWEGWHEWSHAIAPESSELELHGDWRKLEHWEMCRVREGLTPWVAGR